MVRPELKVIFESKDKKLYRTHQVGEKKLSAEVTALPASPSPRHLGEHLLGEDPSPTLRLLFPGVPGPKINYGGVRVRVQSPLRWSSEWGFKWREAVFDQQKLTDGGWTFEVLAGPDLSAPRLPAQPALLLVAPQGLSDEYRQDIYRIWEQRGVRVDEAKTRAELKQKIAHTTLVHLCGEVIEAKGPQLKLATKRDAHDLVPWAEWCQWVKSAQIQAIYCDLNLTDPISDGFKPFPEVPLQVWEAGPQRPSIFATQFWQAWLNQQCPIQLVGKGDHRAVLVARYSEKISEGVASPSLDAAQAPPATYGVDRKGARGAVLEAVTGLASAKTRRAQMFIGHAQPQNHLERLDKQVRHTLEGARNQLVLIQRDIALPLTPEARGEFFISLQRAYLTAWGVQALVDLPAKIREVARGPADRPYRGPQPVVWLSWGTYGGGFGPALTADELGHWWAFLRDVVAEYCPSDVKIAGLLAIEPKNPDKFEALIQGLEARGDLFRATYSCMLLPALGEVPLWELRDYLSNSGCPPDYVVPLAAVFHRLYAGHYEALVAQLQTLETQQNWATTLRDLQKRAGASVVPAASEEL